MITVNDGVQVKESNAYGIKVSEVRYYYRFTNGFSWDPVGRGEAQSYEIIDTVDPGTPWEVQIYYLK